MPVSSGSGGGGGASSEGSRRGGGKAESVSSPTITAPKSMPKIEQASFKNLSKKEKRDLKKGRHASQVDKSNKGGGGSGEILDGGEVAQQILI